ncbi:MAG: T9SS type A sorting domain-containing protein [Flavobacteriaceae bacterium]|nr:T9SS type A sorting domain-containing protein [Flavobacteriaceae bacterium]
MNIKFYLLLSMVAFSFAAQSQCTKTYSGTGVYPTQLANAYEKVPYTFEVDFTFPVDTTIGNVSIHIDSLVLTSCTGFPGTNFNYTCGAANCSYAAGSLTKFQGCIMLNGTAPSGSAGNYKLIVGMVAHFKLPFVGAQSQSFKDSTAQLTVVACNLNASAPVPDVAIVCPGKFANLWADSGNYTYMWLKDGSATTDTTRSITVSDSSKYMVILEDENGCIDTSAAGMLGIYAQPTKPTLAVTGTMVTCTPASMNYRWYKSPLWDSLIVDSSIIYCGNLPAQFNGSIMVKYKNNDGCWSGLSDSASLNCFVGIERNTFSQDFNIFPNPANGNAWLYISSNVGEQVSMNLLDATGRLISTKKLSLVSGVNWENINLNELTKGIYLVQLSSQSGQTSKQLVVE